jgi:Family of unknown function (DUF6523)
MTRGQVHYYNQRLRSLVIYTIMISSWSATAFRIVSPTASMRASPAAIPQGKVFQSAPRPLPALQMSSNDGKEPTDADQSVKGFAKASGKRRAPSLKKTKSAAQVKRENAATKYDEISAAGGQEYNIFVRQFGSSDQSWLPCGAIAVPRGAQVSSAIYGNVAPLQQAIVRTYPKLRGCESEFEYGFNLKIYPDDPIEVAMKGGNTNDQSPFAMVGNWISNVLSPVDASKVKKES